MPNGMALQTEHPRSIKVPLPCHPLQGLEKEKEEQRKLQGELAAQQKKVAAAEAEAEKVGAGRCGALAGLVGQALCLPLPALISRAPAA